MTALLVILIVLFLFALAGGAAIWFFSQSRPVVKSDKPATNVSAGVTAFRWRYITPPLAVLVLTIAMVGYFYRLLPVEVGYHFQSDGSPDQWLNRTTLILWSLLPQLFLTIVSGVITWLIGKLSTTSSDIADIMVKLGRLPLVMGNMVVIPQVVLFFAMLDIFSYNSYQVHILPLWALSLIVMAIGAVILTAVFIQTIRQTHRNLH